MGGGYYPPKKHNIKFRGQCPLPRNITLLKNKQPVMFADNVRSPETRTLLHAPDLFYHFIPDRVVAPELGFDKRVEIVLSEITFRQL